MIKAIIFDVGGVIVRSGSRQGRTRWEKRLGLKEWESENIIFNSEMNQKAERGEVSDESFWKWAKSELQLSDAEYSEFIVDFWADNKVDQDLMTLIRGLRPQYQTAVISNATDTLRQDMKERYQISDAFDLIVCSAEEHIVKPEPEIFLRTLARLKVKPEESLFVDDMEVNVDAARKLGMTAIRFTPAVDLASRLQNYGVSIGE